LERGCSKAVWGVGEVAEEQATSNIPKTRIIRKFFNDLSIIVIVLNSLEVTHFLDIWVFVGQLRRPTNTLYIAQLRKP
jgi:hypothetical protein